MGENSGKSGKSVCNNSLTPQYRLRAVMVSVYDRSVYKMWLSIHIVDCSSVSDCIEMLNVFIS